MRIADQTGGRFVVLDAISEDAARLYARYGFVPLASQPDRMVLGMAKIRASERERQRRRSEAAYRRPRGAGALNRARLAAEQPVDDHARQSCG